MSKGTTEPRLPLQALVPRILLSRRPRSSQHARVTVTVAELAITSALAFRFSEERFLRAPPTSVPSSRQRDHYKHTRCLQLRSLGGFNVQTASRCPFSSTCTCLEKGSACMPRLA